MRGDGVITAQILEDVKVGGGKKLKGRGAHEGGKRKCPRHCRRHTRRTRRALRKSMKHHKKSKKHHKKSLKHHKKSLKLKSRKGGAMPFDGGTLQLVELKASAAGADHAASALAGHGRGAEVLP